MKRKFLLSTLKPKNKSLERHARRTLQMYARLLFLHNALGQTDEKREFIMFDYLMKHKNSYLPFHKFLEKQSLALVPTSETRPFLAACANPPPLSIDLLVKLDLYHEEKINFFIESSIIFKSGNQLYAPDYLREEVDEIGTDKHLHRIHRYIIDLYSSQLPLKPLERDICVSRQTMRKEIEYHKLFLPKTPKNIENANVDINYLSYYTVFDYTEEKTRRREKRNPFGIAVLCACRFNSKKKYSHSA